MNPFNRNNSNTRRAAISGFFRQLIRMAVVMAILLPIAGGDPFGLVAQDDRAFVPKAEAVKVKESKPEGEAAKGGESADSEKTGEGEGESEVVTPQLSRLFPMGRPFRGVRIPSYTGDSLTSVVEAEVMRRIDEDHLDLEQLVITSFSEGEEADTRIFMEQAIYDLKTEKLESRSEAPTRIVQPRFDMVGDHMVFDNKTQEGHMTGNVKMRIFEVDHVFSGGMLGGQGTDSDSESEKPPTSD